MKGLGKIESEIAVWVLLWDIQWVASWNVVEYLELANKEVFLNQDQFHLADQERWGHEDDLVVEVRAG
jgi:hypothetical protein